MLIARPLAVVRVGCVVAVLSAATFSPLAGAVAADGSFSEVVRQVQPKLVKIYGAGGFRGLEAYQSGFLISADGYIATVWSYVLDTDAIHAVLDDGRRFDAKLLAADPRLDLAVLKIEAQNLPHFDLSQHAQATVGARVLAFSNLYGVAEGNEPTSVQHGCVAAVTNLSARRGTYETPYKGPVYVVDAMTNNAGAAGGVLTDRRGQLLGMLGKELRSAQNNTWLNYAIPIAEMTKTIDEIRAGRFVRRPLEDPQAKPAAAWSLELLGIVLVPEVLERTPPYVDAVRSGSFAERAGLRPDDLVVFVGDKLVPSSRVLRMELEYVDRIDPVRMTIMRGQELIDVELGRVSGPPPGDTPRSDRP